MKKNKKTKKENNNLLKTLCVVVFVFMLIAALFSQNLQQSQGIASSPLAPLFKFFTYTPQKSVQIGWFTIFYPTATPAPTSAPTPTPTPCPFVQTTSTQNIAMVVQHSPTPAPTDVPYIPVATNTQGPTKTPGPTRTPAPTKTPAPPGAATSSPTPVIYINPCP